MFADEGSRHVWSRGKQRGSRTQSARRSLSAGLGTEGLVSRGWEQGHQKVCGHKNKFSLLSRHLQTSPKFV